MQVNIKYNPSKTNGKITKEYFGTFPILQSVAQHLHHLSISLLLFLFFVVVDTTMSYICFNSTVFSIYHTSPQVNLINWSNSKLYWNEMVINLI